MRVSNVHVGTQVCVVDPWVGLCSVYLGLNVGFLGKAQRNWTTGRVVGGYLVAVLGIWLLDQTGYEVAGIRVWVRTGGLRLLHSFPRIFLFSFLRIKTCCLHPVSSPSFSWC